MRTIDFYIDAAITELRKTKPETSERDLSKALGFGPSTVCNYRTKRAWPSDDTMIELAKLAKMDPQAALLDLNVWRAKTPAAKKVYESLARALTAACLALAILAGPSSAMATDREQIRSVFADLYIMR